MGKRKEKKNKKIDTKKRSEIKRQTLFSNLTNTIKRTIKNGEIEIKERKVTKEDKKAIKITIAIILGLGLLLWFLPFTHQFMEDFIFLRF